MKSTDTAYLIFTLKNIYPYHQPLFAQILGFFEFSKTHFNDLTTMYTSFNLPMKSQMKTFLWKMRADLKPWWKTCSSAATKPLSPHSNTVRLPLCGEQHTVPENELLHWCLRKTAEEQVLRVAMKHVFAAISKLTNKN